MAGNHYCSKIRNKESHVGWCRRGEDEDKDTECLQQFPCCPACKQEYDIILILPCSHTMCSSCVAAGEGARPCDGPQQHICSVRCPCCRHPVELPCWTWSSATSCLPKHPTMRSNNVSKDKGVREGSPEDHPQHVQEAMSGITAQTGLYCKYAKTTFSDQPRRFSHNSFRISLFDPDSSSASSVIIPEDGAVDLQEKEMEDSVFGLHFALDPTTSSLSLHLSNSSLTVTYHEENLPALPPEDKLTKPVMTSDPGALRHVRADIVIARGQYYWEVDVCNSSIYKIGVISLGGSNSWWLERHCLTFRAVYDGSCELLSTVPPCIKTIGVFLNIGGGTLSFHNPLTQEHITTLPTRFSTAGVVPALGLGQGRLRLRCGLPPPPHVFLSKESTYREPCGNSGGEWRREVPFQSVRKVIQKFEELALSDSDSGLVSSFGSSRSTLASFPDVGAPGTFHSGKAEQETGVE